MVCGHMYHDRCIGAMSTAEKKHMRELTCCVCKTLNTPVDIGSKEFPLVLSPSPTFQWSSFVGHRQGRRGLLRGSRSHKA